MKKFDSNIIGQRIVSILLYDSVMDLDEGFIELENGCILSEVKITPVGIPAGVKFLNSIIDLEKLYGTNYVRVLRNN